MARSSFGALRFAATSLVYMDKGIIVSRGLNHVELA